MIQRQRELILGVNYLMTENKFRLGMYEREREERVLRKAPSPQSSCSIWNGFHSGLFIDRNFLSQLAGAELEPMALWSHTKLSNHSDFATAKLQECLLACACVEEREREKERKIILFLKFVWQKRNRSRPNKLVMSSDKTMDPFQPNFRR